MSTAIKVGMILVLSMAIAILSVWSPLWAGSDLVDIDLYILGVYEGHTHKYGKVSVFVAPADRPIVLLLVAYESVDWQLELEPGARLEKVLLSGYHEQHVSGLPSGIPVETTSYDQRSATYLYGYDNASCFKLVGKAQQMYGVAPKAHLCQYRGSGFVVDRHGIRVLPMQ